MSSKRHVTTKLTPELQERLVTYLRAGNYLDVAIKCAGGIHRDTFYEWMRIGRETGEEPFASFVQAVDRAMADSEARDVALIAKAASDPKLWTAAAWRLERRFPDRWGRRERVDLEAQVQHSGSITVFLPPEE